MGVRDGRRSEWLRIVCGICWLGLGVALWLRMVRVAGVVIGDDRVGGVIVLA